MFINFIKSFVLQLGEEGILADIKDYTYLSLIDKGFRGYIRVNQIIDKDTKTVDGRPLQSLSNYTEQGLQILITTEIRLYVKKKGECLCPDFRIKSPEVLGVYDSHGRKVSDMNIINRIKCDVETASSYSISFTPDFRRQTGRTSRFVESLLPDEIVVVHDEMFQKILKERITDYEKTNRVIVMDKSEASEAVSDDGGELLRFPHEYYEYYKIPTNYFS